LHRAWNLLACSFGCWLWIHNIDLLEHSLDMLKIDEYLPYVNCIPRADMYILAQLWTLEQLSAHLIVRCGNKEDYFILLKCSNNCSNQIHSALHCMWNSFPLSINVYSGIYYECITKKKLVFNTTEKISSKQWTWIEHTWGKLNCNIKS
jgi:hypothetical protein